MSDPSTQNESLLSELVDLPPEGRWELFSRAGGSVELLMQLGDESERLALVEVTRALTATETVIGLADAHEAVRPRARARRARAQALAYAGRHEEALTVCEEACKIAERDEPVEAGRAKAVSLHPLGELGRYDEAVAAGEQARAMLLAAGEPQLAARADFNLGGIHQNRDDPARALFHFDRAAPAFTDDPVISGYLQNNRGEALLLLDDFDGAEAAFRSALEACESGGVNVAAAIAQGNLADLAARRGFLQRALYHFEHARQRLAEDAADSHSARMLAEQAEALETLGLPEDAIWTYEQAIEGLDRHGLASEAARARAGLGRAYLHLRRHDDASRTLEAAGDGFERLGHRVARAHVDLALSEVALAVHDADRAHEHVRKAEAELSTRLLDRAAWQHQRARIDEARGHADRALERLNTAIKTAQELDLPPLLADLLHARGRLRVGSDDFEGGLDDLRKAIGQIERVRGALQAEHLRAAFFGERLALYEDFVRATADSPSASASDVFGAVERAKGRTLLDVLRGAVDDPHAGDAKRDGAAQLLSQAARLRSELNVLYSKLADDRVAGEQRVALAEWRSDVQKRERELRALDRRLSALDGVDSVYAEPARLEAVRGLLPARTALIEYFIARDELSALIVTSDGDRIYRRLAELPELRESIQSLRFQINRGARPGAADGARGARLLDAARRELQALFGCLIEPLAETLQDVDRLAIVPHGPLHLVPFHALWDGRAHLLERFAVHAAPSASVLAHLWKRRGAAARDPRKTTALVVAIADEHAPQITGEAEQVAQRLGAETLIGPAATVERVCAAARESTVVHFACHGFFSRESPMASGLKLADRWLSVRDIYDLRLRADLITLSGCNTGRNLLRAGDELVGLLRGFLSGGAASVLVSLWPAHDEKTSLLMNDFYRMWERTRPAEGAKAEALREAQRRAIERNPHPYFWAPFMLVGMP